jgi:hypothetical protein
MKWTSIIKARKKHPHSDMSQARLDIECENDNCPAGKLGLRTMTAHGSYHSHIQYLILLGTYLNEDVSSLL